MLGAKSWWDVQSCNQHKWTYQCALDYLSTGIQSAQMLKYLSIRIYRQHFVNCTALLWMLMRWVDLSSHRMLKIIPTEEDTSYHLVLMIALPCPYQWIGRRQCYHQCHHIFVRGQIYGEIDDAADYFWVCLHDDKMVFMMMMKKGRPILIILRMMLS